MTNVMDILNDYTNKINLEKGAFFSTERENQNIQDNKTWGEEGKIQKYSLILNDNEIVLFEYGDEDESKELEDCEIKESILIRENSLRCLVFSLEEGKDAGETNMDDVSYKISKLNKDNLRENQDILLANIKSLLNINEQTEKIESYLEFIEEFIKKISLFVIEISNLNFIEPQSIRNKITKSPQDFIRTNLCIINEKNSFNFFIYDPSYFDTYEILKLKKIGISKYPFLNDLLFFFESAQKVPFNHIKYLEYYHVLEYFATGSALKLLENLFKEFIQVYVEEKDYEKLSTITKKLYESLPLPVKDEVLIEVIKRIDYGYIANMLNDHNLIKSLQKEYLGIPTFIHNSFVNGGKLKSDLDDKDKKDFYKKLYDRIYDIRNKIVHSKADFKKEGKNKFIPDDKNLKDLESDLALIKILAYKLAKLECSDIFVQNETK